MKTKTCIFVILLAVGITSSRAQDTWTQKADFGGGVRAAAVGFSIVGKGYIGTGSDASTVRKDFWEYDPAIDIGHRKPTSEELRVTEPRAFRLEARAM